MLTLLKFLHVFFVFLWIGSLLTITRFLIYHGKQSPETQLALAKLYKRVYFQVELPSMLLAITLGGLVLFLKGVEWTSPWLHMKLTFAFLLIVTDSINGWEIVRLAHRPFLGRGIGYKILHLLALLFFIGVLASIYIIKLLHR